MIVNRSVEISRGHVLTGDMLREMNDFPKMIFNLQYAKSGDGILKGLELKQVEDDVIISKGIIKYQDKLYISDTELSLNELVSNLRVNINSNDFYLYLEEDQSSTSCAVTTNTLRWRLSEKKLAAGILVMQLSDDMKDMFLLPRKINIDAVTLYSEFISQDIARSRCRLLEGQYSCLNGNTYLPYVFSAVRYVLEHKESLDVFDRLLLMQLNSSETVTLDTIKSYISSKEIQVKDIADRLELFKLFVEALQKHIEFHVALAEEKKEESVVETKKPKRKHIVF